MQVHARQHGLVFTPMGMGGEMGGQAEAGTTEAATTEAATTVSYAGTDATNSDEDYE